MNILAIIYIGIMIFVLGFGMADEMSFVNPNYTFVIGAAVGWPIVLLYAIGNHVFN